MSQGEPEEAHKARALWRGFVEYCEALGEEMRGVPLKFDGHVFEDVSEG